MPDRISLVGMEFFGRHGVLPHETQLGQIFRVDTDLFTELRAAASTDDLTQTINYAAVFEVVGRLVEGPPVKLIETLAERIAGTVLTEFPAAAQVRVRVHKPHAPIPGNFGDVYCEVLRDRG